MMTHAGEVAQKTADIYCEQCGSKLHIVEGEDVPRCPECDGDTYGDQNTSQRQGRSEQNQGTSEQSQGRLGQYEGRSDQNQGGRDRGGRA